MADLIDRRELRDALYEADAVTMQGVKIINQFPAVDAVEVVRCRDCKHSDHSLGTYWCDRFDTAVQYDGMAFCSYGGRRKERK